uniref:TIGR03087 family PEP-CTERM/XrtA system glycosyltransferase n=1 Tax=Hydrogenophaga sp. TaxID=1904254 RepID=UPI0035617A20
VFLGTFIDDPDDEQHLSTVRGICPDLHVERINPRMAKVASLTGLLTGEALTLAFYRSAGMRAWVDRVVAEHAMDASVVFSSAMAQYAQPLLPRVPMVVDFVDVDSAKWSQYAPEHRWPMSWLYRREGQRLLAFERQVALQARQSFFVTPNEVALFLASAPESADRVRSVSNGVNADFFAPDAALDNPFASGELPVVFTGAMDYWPNVDGVSWFVADILPRLRQRWPQARFYIVGRHPTAQVLALASEHVVVTGTVPDVRPYIQHAAAVVAPLRVARGIQNKILEAMAMAQPVVTVPSCAEAIGASSEQGLIAAASEAAFEQAVQDLLAASVQRQTLGAAARQYVLQAYSWQAHLSGIDPYLVPVSSEAALEPAP